MNTTAPITADSQNPDSATAAEPRPLTTFKLRGRPVPDSVMAKYREPIPPGRTPAWLTEFKREILEYKAAGLTYAQIWDALAKRYPFVPQFAEFTEPKDKTSRIAVFLARHPTRTPRQRTEPNKANKTNGASND